jgi:predicted O-methyltransferase YrrM
MTDMLRFHDNQHKGVAENVRTSSIVGAYLKEMISSLQDPVVSRVLDALHAQADSVDPPLLAHMGDKTDDEMAHLLNQAFIPVSPDAGRFLYTLVRATKGTVVEFGTSLGISTIYLAAAVRDRGGERDEGSVVTTELHAGKAHKARENLHAAGLLDYVDLREGDALETLQDVTGGVTLLFLDGWKKLYLPVLKLLEPALKPGALVAADDLDLFPEIHKPYLAYVRNPENGYVTVEVPIGDRIELSVRT